MIGSKTLFYFVIVCVMILSFLDTRVNAKDPMTPDVNYVLDARQEEVIQGLEGLSVPQVFNRLKSVEVLTNEKFLNKAVYYAFQNRPAAAIAYAFNALKQQTYQRFEDGSVISRGTDVYISSKVFEMFPDEAIDPLLELYQYGDAITRSNIVRASGKIMNHQKIRNLLISALDDKGYLEETENTESAGNPMRVCDEAYNQIVLNLNVKDVLRTISSDHKVEIRDYHIEKLKEILQNNTIQ